MYTGIITETGKIKAISETSNGKRFKIETQNILKDKKIDDSLAVDGVCVTIIKIEDNKFTFDAINETLSRTTLNSFKKDRKVNLEPCLRLNQSLDGHLVQGHVDGVGTVKEFKDELLTISNPPELNKFIAMKGSITINGVSLTVSKIHKDAFSVSLIPHTKSKTNLGELQKGDKVNLEVDLLTRYLNRLIECR